MTLRAFRSRLRYLIHRRRLERDLEEELRFHLEMRAQSYAKQGTPNPALTSRRHFGNTSVWKETLRELWRFGTVETIIQDVRYALRLLARSPLFTCVAVISLALGIGANAAIFTLIDNVMLRLLPVSDPAGLVAISNLQSYPRYEKLRDSTRTLSGLFASASLDRVRVNDSIDPTQQAVVRLVSGNYFDVLGVKPALGRTMTRENDSPGANNAIAVLSYDAWHRRFEGDPAVLGRAVKLGVGVINGGVGTSGFEPENKAPRRPDGATFTIVGIAPKGFHGEFVGLQPDFYVPIQKQVELMPGRPWIARDTATWVRLMGRRNPGVTDQQVAAEFTVLNRRFILEEAGGQITDRVRRNVQNYNARVEPGGKGVSWFRRDFSQPLLILMTMVGLVLLIACANIANLLLARATARTREIGVRVAVGASRVRLIRQMLTESLLLAFAGAAGGLAFARWGAEALFGMVANRVDFVRLDLTPDARVLGFTAAVAILTALIFGLAPAIRATRVDLLPVLKSSATNKADHSSRLLTGKIFIAGQVAISVMVVVGAVLFVRSLWNLKSIDLGYPQDNLIVMRVDPVSAGHRGEEISRVIANILDRVRSIPGVKAATFSENGLFSGTESGSRIRIEGIPPGDDNEMVARFDQIGPDYFTVVGIPLLLGRDMSVRDVAGAPRVAVVNETFVKKFLKSENPIGRRIVYGGPDSFTLEIVGVAKDVKDHSVRDTALPRFYVSYYQPVDGITTANFEVRTAMEPTLLFNVLEQEVKAADSLMPVIKIRTIQRSVDETLLQQRLVAVLSAAFGGVALVLAAIGLYGLMAYSVSRRRSEIGIRMAIGARQGEIIWMVLRESLVLVVIGIAIGVPAALATSRFAATFIYGLTPNDPVTAMLAGVGMLLTGAAAAALPAWRASRLDPMLALRDE